MDGGKENRLFGPGYGGRFIREVALGFALVVLVSGAAFYLFHDRVLEGGYLTAVFNLEKARAELGSGVLVTALFQVVLFSLLAAVLSLLWTHRIAGPLYRLRRSFDGMAAGDLTGVIRFREGDQLQGLASELNAGVKEIRQRAEEIREGIEALERTIGGMNARDAAGEGKDEERIGEILASIKELSERIKGIRG